MGYENNGLSPADFGALIRGGNGGSGWGMNGIGDLIALIIVGGLFGNGGFGGGFGGGNILPWLLLGGFGGNFGGGITAGNNVLSSDFAQIDRRLDGIANGLCDGFYAQNTNTLNGFAGVQNTLAQGFAGINTGMVQQGYETRLGIQGIGAQMAQCCCDIRDGIAGVNNNISTGLCGLSREVERGFCDTQYRDAMNTNNLMQSGHADADRIIAKLDAMETARKDERIAQLTSDNNALKFQISQEGQSRWLYEQLGPKCPQAAYVVQPPQPVNFPQNSCGCNNGWGTWAA